MVLQSDGAGSWNRGEGRMAVAAGTGREGWMAVAAGRGGGADGAGSWLAHLSPAVLELLHVVFPVGPVWAPPPRMEASRAIKLLTRQHPRRTRHRCSAF